MPGAAEGRRDSLEAGAAGDPASSRPFSPRPERPRERGAPPDDDGTREEDGAGSPPDFAASRSLQDGFPPARARRGGPEGAGRSLESVRSMGTARPIGEARAMGDSVRADGTSFPSARSFSFSLQPSLAPAKGNGGRYAAARVLSFHGWWPARCSLCVCSASCSLLSSSLLQRSHLQSFLTFLFSDSLQFCEFSLLLGLSLSLLLCFLSSSFFLLPQAFALVSSRSRFSRALRSLNSFLRAAIRLLQLPLGITTALLEFIMSPLNDVFAVALIAVDQSTQSVLELNILLVLSLGFFQSLSLCLLISFQVSFTLLSIVFWQFLGFLLSESSLKMVDSLASDSEFLIDVVLLTLKLGKLHSTETIGIKVVQVIDINVNSLGTNLEIGDLLLEFLFPYPVQLSLQTLLFTFLLFQLETVILSFLELCSLDALPGGIFLLFPCLDFRCFFLPLLDDLFSCQCLPMFLI